MAWHAYFRQILQTILKSQHLEVFAEFEIGQLPLKIDLVLHKTQEISVTNAQLNEIVSLLKEWMIVELKFLNESFNFNKLLKVLTYYLLFCEAKRISVKDLNTVLPVVITTRKPVKLFKELQTENYLVKPLAVKGFYQLKFFQPIIIVVINELPITTYFLPLLLFSQGRKLEETLKFVLETENKLFISWSYILHQKELIQVAKAAKKSLDRISLNVREAILTLGIRNVIDELGLKEVIDAVGLKEVIDAVGLKEVIDAVGYEQILQEMDPKEIEKFLQKSKNKK